MSPALCYYFKCLVEVLLLLMLLKTREHLLLHAPSTKAGMIKKVTTVDHRVARASIILAVILQ